jgi:hypothetical protein
VFVLGSNGLCFRHAVSDGDEKGNTARSIRNESLAFASHQTAAHQLVAREKPRGTTGGLWIAPPGAIAIRYLQWSGEPARRETKIRPRRGVTAVQCGPERLNS